jgi:hypothetical protein
MPCLAMIVPAIAIFVPVLPAAVVSAVTVSVIVPLDCRSNALNREWG